MEDGIFGKTKIFSYTKTYSYPFERWNSNNNSNNNKKLSVPSFLFGYLFSLLFKFYLFLFFCGRIMRTYERTHLSTSLERHSEYITSLNYLKSFPKSISCHFISLYVQSWRVCACESEIFLMVLEDELENCFWVWIYGSTVGVMRDDFNSYFSRTIDLMIVLIEKYPLSLWNWFEGMEIIRVCKRML